MRPRGDGGGKGGGKFCGFLSIQGGAPTNSYVEDPCFGHPYHIKG